MNLIERTGCPVCNSQQRNVVYKLPYSAPEIRQYLMDFYGPAGYPEPDKLKGFDFVLAECGDCKLIYQVFVPDNPSLETLYTKWISQDKVYDLYEKRREFFVLERYFIIVKNLVNFIGHRDFKLFDYGFGYCHFLKQAALLGIDVYGFEFNHQQIELAKQAGVKVIRNFDLKDDEKMDVIFCEQVLEHTVNPREVMAHLAKLARPGSLLHIGVPNSYNVRNVLKAVDWKNMKGNDNSVNDFAPLEHINSFCHEQVVRLAAEFGFSAIPFPLKYEVGVRPDFETATFKGFAAAVFTRVKYFLKHLVGYKPANIYGVDIYFRYEPRS